MAPVALPRAGAVGLDGTVLLVVLGVSVATGLLFGLAPVFRLALGDVQDAIHDGARSSGSAAGRRLQGAFVVGQVALALMLVAGAGLLIRSFANLQAVDPGFHSTGVLTVELDLPPSVAPSDTAVIEFYDQLLSRTSDLPGVVAAGDASSLPLGADHDYVQPFRTDRADLSPDLERRAAFRSVSPGFFDAMQTPIVEGRGLDRADRLGSRGVAVVNEAFSRRFLDGESPLGIHLVQVGYRFGPLGAINVSDAEIVGVVHDVKYDGLRSDPQPAIYFSDLQSSIRRRTVTLRTTGDPADLLPGLRREVAALSSQVALTDIRTMGEVLADARAGDRFATLLLSLFGLVALVLASVGVYGVLAYAVAQRTQEVGIRMALGADRTRVRGMVLRDGMRLVAWGLALGLVGALALGGVLASQLYGVSPRDPETILAVTAVLLGAGLAASLLPAWRATRVDPVRAMRTE
jgi:putative ABC transport system permease protein